MKISTALLIEKGACSEQVNLFQKLFGDHTVSVSKELCVQHASMFNWDWAAKNLFTGPAWKAYDEAKAPALKAYNEAKAKAFATGAKLNPTTKKG